MGVSPRVFSLVALVGILYFGLAVLALHLLPTGYDPLTHAVSDYAVGTYGPVMDSAFVAFGIGVFSLAIALSRPDSSSVVHSRLGVPLLSVAGACLFAVGFFPTDLEGAPATSTGDIHTGLSAVVFLAMVVSVPVLSRAFGRSDKLRSYYRLSLALAIVVVALFFVADATITEGVYGGLGERVFILGFYSWLLLASIRVFRLS
jgi:hypothetical membrane protein